MSTTRTQLLTDILNQDVAEIIMQMTEKLEKPKRDMDAVIKHIGEHQGWIGFHQQSPFLRRIYLKYELKGRELNKLFKLNPVHYTSQDILGRAPTWSGVELLSRQLFKTPRNGPCWVDVGYTLRMGKSDWIECATRNGIDVKRSWTIKRIKHELMKV